MSARKGVLVVTGGGRGIGRAIALGAAARGWDVLVNFARDAASAEAVVASCRAAGAASQAVRGDVAVEADVLAIFAAADAMGRLAGLVNNAGIVATQGRLEDFSADRIARMFAVNSVGAILCAREAVRRMSTKRGGAGGAIVNLSSVAARLGGPGDYVDYAASKGAIDSFTVGLAKEVAADGIRVNVVSPGVIETEIHASGGEPGRAARVGAGVPMGRAGGAEEIAAAVLWLLSDEASYVTGANVVASGGRL
ncbi:MAG: SDR family oxidoreductase [Hyphomicrobiales bacterium]|nr:SDR family oxidoreductase [Hyphomicrobiales bacterium]MDE2018592.1 SDR family oxidoreductase [Hyphomicrobiales bacterium]